MRQLVLGTVMTVLVLFSGAAGAAADEIINVPIDTVITRQGVREGDVRLMATAPVDADLVGSTCFVESEADNQTSVHPGNDVIVSSGSDQVVIPGVEDEPGQISLASGTLTLGTEIAVSVRLGPDRQFSGGIIVSLDCDLPASEEPTTTVATLDSTEPESPETTVVDTTIAETTTTVASSDTTEPPTTDTEPPSQTEASTTPTTTPEPGEQEQGELPNTGGVGSGTFAVIALALIGGGLALVLVSRRPSTGWID